MTDQEKVIRYIKKTKKGLSPAELLQWVEKAVFDPLRQESRNASKVPYTKRNEPEMVAEAMLDKDDEDDDPVGALIDG